MSGFAVFQAYDGKAAEELAEFLPEIDLLVLNTEGTGMDTPALVDSVRKIHPALPVLHIGPVPIPGMPADVVNLADTFSVRELLATVERIVDR